MNKPEENAVTKEIRCTSFFRVKCNYTSAVRETGVALQHDWLSLDPKKTPLWIMSQTTLLRCWIGCWTFWSDNVVLVK